MIRRYDTMRTIFAEYNPNRNSIDVYTSVGYMLLIDCWEVEKNLKTTPGSDCALNALTITFFQSFLILLLFSISCIIESSLPCDFYDSSI